MKSLARSHGSVDYSMQGFSVMSQLTVFLGHVKRDAQAIHFDDFVSAIRDRPLWYCSDSETLAVVPSRGIITLCWYVDTPLESVKAFKRLLSNEESQGFLELTAIPPEDVITHDELMERASAVKKAADELRSSLPDAWHRKWF